MSTTTTEALPIPRQRERVANRDWRIGNANLALVWFAPDTAIVADDSNRLVVSWRQSNGVIVDRRWQCRSGQDFYPVWSQLWGHGGTCCTALSQLIRWIQGRPVLPLSTWRYWAGDGVRLAREDGNKLIARLIHAEYPEHAHCVLCGRQLGGLDWWNLNGVSGPCCGWTSGCRQTPGRLAGEA